MDQNLKLKLVRLAPHDQIPFTPVRDFDFDNHPVDPIQLSNEMQLLTHELSLLSISGPQVGLDLNVFYVRGFESACFNARVVDVSEGDKVMEEVSSSTPDLVIKIKRPEVIRVRWTDATGKTDTHVYSGLTARSIQRKIDMINGIQLVKRANKFHRDKALKRMKY